MAARTYSVVLYGSTGFTGGLVAEYFAANAPLQQLPWAIAGRSQAKLEKVKARLVEINPECANLDIVIASSSDQQSVNEMVQNANVIVTTVGPFDLYGEPIVKACVQFGTDYVDTTGETQFMQRIIAKYGQAAKQKGIKLVPTCGFDSIPSDLGVFRLADHLRSNYGLATKSVTTAVRIKGNASAGTVSSIFRIIDSGKMRETGHPYALNANKRKPTAVFRANRDSFLPVYDNFTGRWTAPFVMAGVNTRVVRRSDELVGNADDNDENTVWGTGYGDEFVYVERMVVPNFFAACVVSLGLALFGILAFFRFTRPLVMRLAVGNTAGPSAEARAKSWFRYTQVAHSVPDATGKVVTVTGKVSGGDPGYTETAKMVSEAGLALALQRNDLPATTGILTPAAAFGSVLVDRLVAAGLKFDIEDSNNN